LAFGEQVLRIAVCQYCSLKACIDPVSWNVMVYGADGGMRSLDLTIEIAATAKRVAFFALRAGALKCHILSQSGSLKSDLRQAIAMCGVSCGYSSQMSRSKSLARLKKISAESSGWPTV
jgi:hypothetical protein